MPPRGAARRTQIGLAVAAALAGAAVPTRSRAPTAAATSASGRRLQEVIVTARKREENLQDVPISIDVFTEEGHAEPRHHQLR